MNTQNAQQFVKNFREETAKIDTYDLLKGKYDITELRSSTRKLVYLFGDDRRMVK